MGGGGGAFGSRGYESNRDNRGAWKGRGGGVGHVRLSRVPRVNDRCQGVLKREPGGS